MSSVVSTVQPNDLIKRFSSLTKLTRVLSYCIRFLKRERNMGSLCTKELHQTLMHCVKTVQHEVFTDEIKLLSTEKKLQAKSKLNSLRPFIDEEGVMRVLGRLENANLPYNQRHPIILPHSHHLTTLIVRDAHHQTLHGGAQATLAYIRRKFWVIDAMSTVKLIIRQCTTCCRYKAATSRQLMGQLPAPRVQPSPPFTNTGVDYAGPFNLRMSKGKGTKSFKGYISIFVCLCTKAIHLEAVSDLTTEAFLAAFKRFISRRGPCFNIYSDCGTTFVGAKNELEKQFNLTIDKCHKEAAQSVTNHSTQWHFIPPASPHFGGLWEAGVKSTKHHLKRIAGDVKWTYEEFSTLLAQIEACLNSRPLCPLSNDPDDLAVLTPGHFLVGRPLIAPLEYVTSEKPINLLKRWELVQRTRNDFWKSWSSEYLTRLQQRTKWQTENNNLQVGDMVFLKEDKLPPGHWSLGRIDSIHPGSDGLVRVVTTKTNKGLTKRPITKICKLPFETQELPDPELPSGQSTGSKPSTQIHAHLSLPAHKPNEIRSKRSEHTCSHQSILASKSTRQGPTISHHVRKRPKINPTNIPLRPAIEELRNTAQTAKRKKISTLATSALLLNCILNVMSLPIMTTIHNQRSQPAIEILPFDHNPGIYMEHITDLHLINNAWNMVIYYDLTTYYPQLKGFENCLQKLRDLCNKTIAFNYYCKSVVSEYSHKVAEMKLNNLVLHKRNGNHFVKEKNKRAPLEIIGAIQHSLFGVLDQSYADYIQEEITKLKTNENYLLSLARNQTSITEATTNILKKTVAQIQQQFEVFDQHLISNLDALKATSKQEDLKQTFNSMVSYTNIIMNSYEKVEKELIELVLDAHHGKISPFLLTPEHLRQQIKYIREHISTTLIIPGETNPDELLGLYKIMTVKSRVTDTTIIFKIQIPLPEEKKFQIFKLYSVPSEHNGQFHYIEPSTEFLAASLHRDLYYPLTQTELNQCFKSDHLGTLCQQKKPIYTLQATISRCEMALLNHRTPPKNSCQIKYTKPSHYWIQLQHPNHWIFVAHEDTIINIVCDNQVIVKKLHKSGIIKLQQNCQIKHATMTINTQTIFSEKKKLSFIPLTNISAILSNNQPLAIANSHVPLVHLDTQALNNIQFNKIKGDFPVVDPHHVHHYFITYLMANLAIAAFIWYKYSQNFKKCCKKPSNTDSINVTFTPIPAKRTVPSTSAPPPV